MSLLLNVPDAEREHAASMGAQWDAVANAWYLPEDQYDRLIEVAQWIPEQHPAIILPTEISMVHAQRPCWKCGHSNQVVALAGNYFFEKDMNERDESVWMAQDFFTLFQQVATISDNLQSFLQDNYPFYKLARPGDADHHYWCNHCTSCNSIQGDWFLFDEAGSVFNPTEKEAAARLTIRNYQLKYAPLIDAVYSLGDPSRLINEFAGRAASAEEL